MHGTGIVRRIDDLGRIVIPKEVRHTLRIHVGDPLELYVDGDCIVWKKYSILANMDSAVRHVARALEDKAISFAIFDTDKRLMTGGCFEEDKWSLTPRDWVSSRFGTLRVNNAIVYSIFTNGDLVGFVAAMPEEDEKPFVEGIVHMMSIELTDC